MKRKPAVIHKTSWGEYYILQNGEHVMTASNWKLARRAQDRLNAGYDNRKVRKYSYVR